MKQPDLDSLYDFNRWLLLDQSEVYRIARELETLIASEFTFCTILERTEKYGVTNTPIFSHRQSGLSFCLIIGGRYTMGLSASEGLQLLTNFGLLHSDWEAQWPPHPVQVRPFLCCQTPISEYFARQYIALTPRIFRPDFTESGSRDFVIHLTRAEATRLCEIHRLELPSEAQWEYAYRGLTQTPFYFGSSLPSEEILGKEIMLTVFDDVVPSRVGNPFSLAGLCSGEWCKDSFQPYNLARDTDEAVLGDAPFVFRGGAAMVWPWQDPSEWIYLLSAARSSTEEYYDEPVSAVRFVKNLDSILRG